MKTSFKKVRDVTNKKIQLCNVSFSKDEKRQDQRRHLNYSYTAETTEYIPLQEMKQGQCICSLSWSVHCNLG
jgi:hypothetical protein